MRNVLHRDHQLFGHIILFCRELRAGIQFYSCIILEFFAVFVILHARVPAQAQVI